LDSFKFGHDMNIRQEIISRWLGYRAQSSRNKRIVFHAVETLSTITHPAASRVLDRLFDPGKPVQLTRLISAIIDNADGDPYAKLKNLQGFYSRYHNVMVLARATFWSAVLGVGKDCEPLVKSALRQADERIHSAAVEAVSAPQNPWAIPDILVSMAHRSHYEMIDSYLRRIHKEWQSTSEALSAVSELVTAFASADPKYGQATYLVLLEKLNPAWVAQEDARRCIPNLVVFYGSSGIGTNTQNLAHMALNRINADWRGNPLSKKAVPVLLNEMRRYTGKDNCHFRETYDTYRRWAHCVKLLNELEPEWQKSDDGQRIIDQIGEHLGGGVYRPSCR
jgi:hypothetical protein